MKAVISLFDYTGEAVKPWAEAGYYCMCFDLQFTQAETINYPESAIFRSPWDSDDPWAFDAVDHQVQRVGLDVAFVFGWPPCTDLAVSGARHFKSKLEDDPGCQLRAALRARLVEEIASNYGVPYLVENPVSVLSTLWRKPDYTFHPSDYGGYIPEAEADHPAWSDIIPPRDAYTKRTCLWTGGGFRMPVRKPVPVPVREFHGWAKLGGKSLRTKNIRSATPRGFARAVFEEHHVG